MNLAINDGATSLLVSSVNGHQAVVKLLLASGARVNQADSEGWTPFIGASFYGHHDIAKLLLKSGAVMNHFENDSSAALSYAILKGHTKVASLLRHWSLTVPRHLATYACVLHAIDFEEGRASQGKPVKELLQRLARTPDDIARVIVLFVGDGGDAEDAL